MARMSRDKGQRIERELVHLHLDAGIPASRVPLSGAAGGNTLATSVSSTSRSR
jgi:Holliday junction resolvase